MAQERIEMLRRGLHTTLSKLAQGYNQEPYIGEVLLPTLGVNDTHLEIPTYNKDLFRVYNTDRALRAESKVLDQVEYSQIELELKEHSLKQKLDYREIAAAGKGGFNLKVFAARQVTEALRIGKEARIAELVQNLDSYPLGHKETLAGNDQWTDVDSRPLEQIEDAKETIRNAIGIEPNQMTLGHSSYYSLRTHKTVVDAIFGKDRPGIVTLQQLEALLELKISVGRASYATSATSAFSKIWDDNCIIAYVPKSNRSEYTPSFGYSFLHSGFPIIHSDFEENNKKIYVVESTTIETEKVLMGSAGYILKDTNL